MFGYVLGILSQSFSSDLNYIHLQKEPKNCKCLDGARTALSPRQKRVELPWQEPFGLDH